MNRKTIYSLFSLLLVLLTTPLQAQTLRIKGEQFYLDNEMLPLWGVRVASASQNKANTNQLIANLEDYKRHGVNAISVFLQGSSGGFADPFSEGGKQLDKAHFKRLEEIINKCASLKMLVIVGIFYQRTIAMDSSSSIINEQAVFEAVRTATQMLKPFSNVIINIANEQNSYLYKSFKPFDFNDPNNMIRLCQEVKKIDPQRIVGAGGYQDSLNVVIGKSSSVDVLLFDTFGKDVERNQHSGWHYDYFKSQGVPDKPIINVELFGGWTGQFTPPGVYSEEGKQIHTQEIDEAAKRPGLVVHFHSNTWMQGISNGFPVRYNLGGLGTKEDPGIRWYFEYLLEHTN